MKRGYEAKKRVRMRVRRWRIRMMWRYREGETRRFIKEKEKSREYGRRGKKNNNDGNIRQKEQKTRWI